MDAATDQMSDLEVWLVAWRNILSDYKNGKITHHQFLKEQEYMRAGRIQIERGH